MLGNNQAQYHNKMIIYTLNQSLNTDLFVCSSYKAKQNGTLWAHCFSHVFQLMDSIPSCCLKLLLDVDQIYQDLTITIKKNTTAYIIFCYKRKKKWELLTTQQTCL